MSRRGFFGMLAAAMTFLFGNRTGRFRYVGKARGATVEVPVVRDITFMDREGRVSTLGIGLQTMGFRDGRLVNWKVKG